MLKRMILMLLAFGIFVGGLAYYKYSQIKFYMSMEWKEPPIAVTSAVVKKETWQRTIETTGSFSPFQGVTVSAEESGKVVKIDFASNQKVEKDVLLVQLDVSVEEAQLKAAQARAELADANFKRIAALKDTNAIAKKDIDDAEAQLKQANAEIEQLKAVIDRKTIKAPFSGVTGIRQIQIGQYLSPGNPIVSLQTLNPIYLDFTIPQQFLSQLSQGQVVRTMIDAFPNETFEGKINAINPEIDSATRTIRIQATLENAEARIRPGMFARVTVILADSNEYLTIPSTSVQRSTFGDSVYVIEKMKNKKDVEYLGVRQQFVKLGDVRGDQIAVLEGLQEGEEIVTSGLFKLRPQAEVLINNEITPENKPAPKPSDS